MTKRPWFFRPHNVGFFEGVESPFFLMIIIVDFRFQAHQIFSWQKYNTYASSWKSLSSSGWLPACFLTSFAFLSYKGYPYFSPCLPLTYESKSLHFKEITTSLPGLCGTGRLLFCCPIVDLVTQESSQEILSLLFVDAQRDPTKRGLIF